ncbi:hypothetical protein QFC22_002343 [Naganishia vaughanmartiniae]|uniref:Uncharacterized protein n=1 Tax=Naganishia vaughanmartiniae TaxID=1424756 RepID=A0ACC2XEN3_9TREE|nr:hypothetical protein QFC22_002343 [Naganishia vaughanmartiniae]
MESRRKSQPNEYPINSMKLVSFADLLDQQMPSPPASFTQIVEAYVREGRGDVETLKSVLAAKQAEEDRITKILEIRIALLQMHAHKMGMIPGPMTCPSTNTFIRPVSSISIEERPMNPLPVMARNRQRSTSPSYPTRLPPMNTSRAYGESSTQDRVLPSLSARLSSSSSVSSPSAVSERFLYRRPREYSYASETDRPELPIPPSVTGRKRAYTMENTESTASSAPGVYYQARDKHLLPSPTRPDDSSLPSQDSGVSLVSNHYQSETTTNKRSRVDDESSPRPGRCRNGLELLLNAAGRSDSEGSR